MNWEAMGAIGEMVGATSVFLTLAYLALQIRQNTNAVSAAALDSSLGGVTGVRAKIFEDPSLTEIYLQGLENPEALSRTDKSRFTLLMHNILWALWNVYSQARYADLSADVWESQKQVVYRTVSSNGGSWFLKEFGQEFPESFRLEIKDIVSQLNTEKQAQS